MKMKMLHRQAVFGRWGQVLIFLVALWICFMFMISLPILCSNPSKMDRSSIEPVSNRLSQAFLQIGMVKKQNEELKSLFHDFNLRDFTKEQQLEMVKQLDESVNKALDNTNDILESAKSGKSAAWRKDIDQKSNPSIEYENVRKKISTNTREFWNFVHAEVVKAQTMDHSENPELSKVLQNILNLGVEHKRSLLSDLHTLQEVDGYERWRESESAALSDLVQRRLHSLQNPADCSKAKKIVCTLNKGCGYGCQLHHVVYCFVLAYATERTLILHSLGWRYHRGGWEQIFKPLSDTCTSPDGETKDQWPGKWYSQVLTLPIIDALSPRPPFLPLAIPADLAPRIGKIHGAPSAWWLGQFLKFLLKPQPSTANFLEQAMKKMEFKGPIVGVHVRRTDKVGTEAAFHSIDEYMTHVEEYFNQLEMVQKVDKRRVYLASDDPKVILEAIKKYPNYKIIGDTDVAKTAAVSTRYSDNSLHGIILDIHLLSRCDYLVCTFSSQVCRAAYEIMQTLHVDASDRFTSLDDIHYFGGQNAHNVMAVLPHSPQPQNPQEMQLKTGDIIGIAGNHWNGYSKGMNKRTNQVGLFPSFKTVDKLDIAEFPTYTDVPLVPA